MISALASNITKLRMSKKLTKPQLAAAMGVDADTIQKWELGEIVPTNNQIIQIAKMFNVNPNVLVGGAGRPADAQRVAPAQTSSVAGSPAQTGKYNFSVSKKINVFLLIISLIALLVFLMPVMRPETVAGSTVPVEWYSIFNSINKEKAMGNDLLIGIISMSGIIFITSLLLLSDKKFASSIFACFAKVIYLVSSLIITFCAWYICDSAKFFKEIGINNYAYVVLFGLGLIATLVSVINMAVTKNKNNNQ